MQVADRVHRFSGGICNFYVIEDGQKLTLVDAGTPGDWSLLQRSLDSIGHTGDDVDAILLTHAHSDHTGFAERARSEHGAAVFVHALDEPVARGGKPPANDGGYAKYLVHVEAYRTLFSLMRRGGLRVVPIAELSTFADGEVVAVPGAPRVVHVPGHTMGSSAVLFEQRGLLLTGDSLVTRNPLTGRIGPQIMPSGLNHDSARALESLDALLTGSATTVLPGHGEPWKDGAAEAVRRARLTGRS